MDDRDYRPSAAEREAAAARREWRQAERQVMQHIAVAMPMNESRPTLWRTELWRVKSRRDHSYHS